MENMENQGQEVVAQAWNPFEDIKAMIAERVDQIEGIELSADAKNALIEYCAKQKIFRFDEFENLGQFVHFQTEQVPVFSALVGSDLLYVFENRRVERLHTNRYYQHLRDNDLSSEEYSYEQFLEQSIFVDNQEEVVTYEVQKHRIGCVFTSLLREDRQVKTRLAFVSNAVNSLRTVLGDDFVNGIQV